MRSLLCLQLAFSVCFVAWAQPPNVEWDEIVTDISNGIRWEMPRGVLESNDGGYVCAGFRFFYSDPSQAMWLKVDQIGSLTWLDTLSRPNTTSYLMDLVANVDGQYLMCGFTSVVGGPNSSDILLIKADSAGDTIWTRTIGESASEGAYSISPTSDGGYVLGGAVLHMGPDSFNMLLTKVDDQGQLQWQTVYGTDESEEGGLAGETVDGGYFIFGNSGNYPDLTPFIIRTDLNGDSLWTQTYGELGDLEGHGIVHTPWDGGFLFTGNIKNAHTQYLLAVHVVKTDAAGDTLWTRTFRRPNTYAQAWSLKLLPDNGCIVAGSIGEIESQPIDSMDVYVIRLDANGDSLWSLRLVDNTSWTECYEIVTTSDGGFLLACPTGADFPGAGPPIDIRLIKLGPELSVGGHAFPPVVESVTLLGNSPNPFNAVTQISFEIPRMERVTLDVHNVLGQKLVTLIDKPLTAGQHRMTFDAANLPSGTYLYTLAANGIRKSGTMVLVK